jgi:hypothetical protein
MTILQLSPQIPMNCPKGEGYAILLIDYSQDHDLYWTIAINETNEIWTFANHEVRMTKNVTMGRTNTTIEKIGGLQYVPLAVCIHNRPVKMGCSECVYMGSSLTV